MLKSYKVEIEGDRIKWLDKKPETSPTEATILIEEVGESIAKRTTPAHLIGQAKILGDIVSPIVDEEDWECLK